MLDNQVDKNAQIVLPPNIAQGLELALASLPDGNLAKIEEITGGAINHTLVITTPNNRYIFRARKDKSSEDFEEYMRIMYDCSRFLNIGGSFKLRTIAEEIDFIKQAHGFKLPVPQLICTDDNWMVMDYIEGKTLRQLVEAGDINIISKILQELHLAHQRGIIYGDRWGGNEIVDDRGNIYMIDFDIEWLYDGSQRGIIEDLEMSVTIFNSLRLTTKREDFLNLIEVKVLPLLKSWGYNFDRIREFMTGFSEFYLDPNKPNTSCSLSPDLYVYLAEPAQHLLELFSEAK